MATLEIDEYPFANKSTVYPCFPITSQQVTTSGTSASSSAVGSKTKLVSVRPVGGAVRVTAGTGSPTATATDKYLADGEVYDVQVPEGQDFVIAVIDAA